MDEKTTENEAITQPFEPEPLSEQTMVSNATMPLQVPDSPPPPPPIPVSYVPPSSNSSWRWILGSTIVVILVLVAGAIGFTAGYGEGCPCDPTRDARNNAATISVIQGSSTALSQTAVGLVLTLDAQEEIIGENEFILGETIAAVEGTSQALSTALFVNATSRATQQAVATSNVMTIQAAETAIAERDGQLTSVYATVTAIQATIAAPSTTPPPSEGLQGESLPSSNGPTTAALPPDGSTLVQIVPSSSDFEYPFVPVFESVFFRDAWLHEGCSWQGIAGNVIFLQGNTQTNLQIRVSAPDSPPTIVTIGTNKTFGENGWEAKVANAPENLVIYHVQLYDNDGVTPLSPNVEVRFNGQCTMNLLQLDFSQSRPLGVG
jgi:hypothetical protein